MQDWGQPKKDSEINGLNLNYASKIVKLVTVRRQVSRGINNPLILMIIFSVLAICKKGAQRWALRPTG
ncbi:MAG: hypothetical protein ACK59Y_00720 [Betaproteobacteria bacterium]|jgi:hypothetical protein|nr:hypothetical protein [Betaproteobacteria bacterium]